MRVLGWWRGVLGRVAPGAGAVLPWLGGAFLLVAAGFGGRTWMLARTQQRAEATVTENVSGFAPGGGVMYRPRLRFQADGRLAQVVVGEGSDAIEFATGERVPVLYPAGEPQQAMIATVWRLYLTAIVCGVIGVVVFDVGLILRLVLARRSAPGRA